MIVSFKFQMNWAAHFNLLIISNKLLRIETEFLYLCSSVVKKMLHSPREVRMEHQILSRKTVFQGHAFDVELVHLRLPDGRERDYDLVSHNDSVTIVPFDRDGSLWFVSQFRTGCECPMLELPAGVIDDGETPEDCAAREVREEIGMAAGKLTRLGSVYLAAGYSSEENHIFLAEDLLDSPLAMDEDEFLNVSCLPLSQVWEMAENGEFKDSKTLAALMLAKPRLFPKNR